MIGTISMKVNKFEGFRYEGEICLEKERDKVIKLGILKNKLLDYRRC